MPWDWLAANPNDADARGSGTFHERRRDEYVSRGRDLLDRPIFVARKP